MGWKAQDELEPIKTNYNLLHYLHVSNFRDGSVLQEVLALFITQLNTNLGEELENLQKKICHDLKSLQTWLLPHTNKGNQQIMNILYELQKLSVPALTSLR